MSWGDRARAVQAVLLVGVHHHLAVRVGGPAVSAFLEPGPQLLVVVDLAVDDRGHAAVLGVERLVAARDVDDGQARVGERDGADAPQRLAIGTAMAQRLDHPLGRVLARRAGRIEDCADPAHAALMMSGRPVTALSHPRLEPFAARPEHGPPTNQGGPMHRFFGRIHAGLLSARGQGTVEYVALILLVALVMAGVVAAMKGFRTDEGKELGDVIVGKIKEAVRKVQF